MKIYEIFKKNKLQSQSQQGIKPTPNNDSQTIDDLAYIKEIKHISSSPWHQYDILLASQNYGWNTMINWADYMSEADLQDISQVTTGAMGVPEIDISESFINSNGKCMLTPELKEESSVLSIAGISKILQAPLKIVWYNQTRVLRLFTIIDDELLMRKYVETLIRRTFGTHDAMKLARPIPEHQ